MRNPFFYFYFFYWSTCSKKLFGFFNQICFRNWFWTLWSALTRKEIDHWCLRMFGPFFIGKSPCTTCRLTFWSIIVRPYLCPRVLQTIEPILVLKFPCQLVTPWSRPAVHTAGAGTGGGIHAALSGTGMGPVKLKEDWMFTNLVHPSYLGLKICQALLEDILDLWIILAVEAFLKNTRFMIPVHCCSCPPLNNL